MSHDSANVDPTAHGASLEEQLVAYLDGELDDEGVRRVEALLATDSKARETLERFEGAWDLLDHLDQAHVGEVFTRSTLEMVAVAAADDVQQQRDEAPRLRRKRWLVGAAGVLAAGLAGFLAVFLAWPDPNEQLLRDVPVLERLDQYRQIDDFEFLELLLENREDLFVEEDADES